MKKKLSFKKILSKAMRITITQLFLSIICCGISLANSAFSQEVLNKSITLRTGSSTIKKVLFQLEKKADVKFVYSPNAIQAGQIVSFNFTEDKLSKVLEDLLTPLNISYEVIDNRILLRKKAVAERENIQSLIPNEIIAEQTISGTITDEKGQALPGVSVLVKNTNRGTSTDTKGQYKIAVPDGNNTLIFSFVGYQKQEVVVNGRSVINVSMLVENQSLDEVVVVGYGTQSRKNLTSAITTIKPEDMNRGAISDVGQLLQGKVPGLNITRSGDPNRAAAIILRGASSLRDGAQSPLFVIDGVPGADISLIAPDDIATMDILKDAAATAIYGNRAANGVIMVTTKRASKGQMQVSYSSYMAIDKVSKQYEMMNATQLKAFLTKNGQALSPEDDLGANTNWQDAVQRSTAISQNHNISFGGGSESTVYNASINYFDQDGIIKSSALNRVVARLSIEQKAFNNNLKLGLSVTNSVSDAKWVPYRNTVLAQMLTYLPTVPVHKADGSFYDNFNKTSYYNPVSLIENGQERLKYKTLVGTFFGQLKLPLGFTYDVKFSYQNFQTNYGAYYNSYYTQYYNNIRSTPEPPGNPSFITLVGANGLATRNAYQNTQSLLETYLTWDKQIGDHSINAVVGYSWQESINGDGFQATSTNFPVDAVGYNNLGLGNPYAVNSFRVNYGGDNYQQVRLISDFGRVNYNYKNKYLLQGSIRRDGSSVFGLNKQWGYFPAVGFAWRVDQEGFMEKQQIFSELKLRLSYGVTGNSAGFSPYTTKLIYGNVGTFYYNGSQQAAIGALQNENPDLGWEKTATSNLGIDFSVAKGKISGTVEVYNKKTSDLIWTYPVSTVLYPNGSLTANVGEMSNKGYEVTLNASPVKTKNFSWNTTFNLAHNENKILSLSNASLKTDSVKIVQPDGGGQTGETIQLIVAGQPIGQFFTYEYAGKDANGVSQYYNSKGELTTKPVSVKDYKAIGNAQPKLLLGWSNNFTYKNLDLNIFMRAVLGNKIMNVTRADLFRPSTARFTNIPVEVAEESANDFNSYRYSSRFLEDGSYLRLDNATLGYSFKNITKDIKRIRLYASVNNLFVITGYKGIDPEINQGGIAPGVDSNNFYPKTRTFLFGVSASF
ncbi:MULTISPECIES: TonB-dependent receptor [unclassified Arcicella]|uniref:TonB-dependent receptor n=1 Tax=unclassified Arcicella TaxID=2644986 RepID=UPI00285F2F85|nr:MULTISPECIES: TonB-dependent receptor [unclassified Arcicella]MDR6560534.1 iron complex outermembrane receptor protein [Arcicella sp. BE51]MDR6809860.1 iron complex outermembrane receptor protein [Arcicella sp. BE140]MDR6821209.1 iron complex outermembrane receptor protein [Arcicella sp. BE139]